MPGNSKRVVAGPRHRSRARGSSNRHSLSFGAAAPNLEADPSPEPGSNPRAAVLVQRAADHRSEFSGRRPDPSDDLFGLPRIELNRVGGRCHGGRYLAFDGFIAAVGYADDVMVPRSAEGSRLRHLHTARGIDVVGGVLCARRRRGKEEHSEREGEGPMSDAHTSSLGHDRLFRNTQALPQEFFERPADALALSLLGCELVHGEVRVAITETEAYLGPEDSAAHARSGPTSRNAPTFGPAGHAYVYLCYGLHQMLNVVAGPPGSAVLIRSACPVAGQEAIRARRGGKTGPNLLTGPGKVGQALGVTTDMSGVALYRPGGLEVLRGQYIGMFREMQVLRGQAPARVLAGPRVGIDFAKSSDRLAALRFAVADTPWVSAPWRTLSPLSKRRVARMIGGA